MRTVYVDGAFVPETEARISIFDRGVLFADAVYEVCAVLESRLVDTVAHLARLRRSLAELGFALPRTDAEILAILLELVRRNRVGEGIVYLQVSRGAADRDFLPPENPEPCLFAFTQAKAVEHAPEAEAGIRVITHPDLRWGRRDIKTVALLAASLAKSAARAAGAGDAWLVEDGHVTEGTSNNAWILTTGDCLVTRPLSTDILAGCTRAAILQLAEEAGLRVEERRFTPEEAREAAEAFITSASSLVTGVVEIDGRILSNGRPGAHTRRLRQIYLDLARRSAVG